MKAEDIKTKADVDTWLAALPPPLRERGCQIIAYRHSLRLLPFLMEYANQDATKRDRHTHSVLLVFRAILLFLAHLRSEGPKPKLGLDDKVSENLNKALARTNPSGDAPERAARLVIRSVWFSTNTLQTMNDTHSRHIRKQAVQAIETGEAFASSTGVTVNAANRKTIDAVKYDAEIFEKSDDALASPLWPDGAEPLAANWLNARALFDAHPAWAVFRDFYERSVSGDPQDWQLLTDLGCEPDDFWTGTDEEVLDLIAEVVVSMVDATVKTPSDRNSVSVRQDKANLKISRELADAIAEAQKLKQGLDLARVQMASLIRSGRTVFEEKISEINKELNEQKEMLRQHIDGVVEAVKAGFALEEPVNLWTVKEQEHREQAEASYIWFTGALIVTGLFIGCMVLLIIMKASDILQAIAPLGCGPVNAPQACSRFSFLGAVMIGLVLTLFTLLLWFTRLKMKEYLS